MFGVQISPFSQSIDCENGETLLEGALRNSRLLRYGCKHGGCGTCKIRLLDGDVETHGSTFALTGEDHASDVILACASVPVSPCVIDVGPSGLTEEEFLAGDDSREHSGQVASVEYLTADIARVRLTLAGDGMPFVAGQFVNVEVPGPNVLRTFSMANSPDEPALVELIVKLYPDGVFSEFLRERAAPGTPIRVFGPHGQLKIRLSHRPILMIAGGSGLAPLLSMLRGLPAGFDRPVTLLFGARTPADIYAVAEIAEAGSRLLHFEFVPVFSHEWPVDWTGETGMVTDACARRWDRLGHDVYLCGPPPMISAAVPMLIERGVRPRNIYYDAFTPAAQTVPI